jgi:hypothetical protein
MGGLSAKDENAERKSTAVPVVCAAYLPNPGPNDGQKRVGLVQVEISQVTFS